MSQSHSNQPNRWEELRTLLNDWDPVGFKHLSVRAGDEYDALIGPVMWHLEHSSPENVIHESINSIIRQQFAGSADLSGTAEFVVKILDWFKDFQFRWDRWFYGWDVNGG